MRFIYPEFLPALAFVIIPILIHFLHFKRYKTVYFSQVNFLKAIKQESKKKNNLKQLLILIARILTIIALVFVFCQPYLPTNKQKKQTARKLVAIYLDNSFSMKNESDNGTLLELAKSKAMSIVNSYGPGTRFLLMDNQNTPNQQQLLSKKQLLTNLAAIHESPGALSMSMAYQQLENNLLKQKQNAKKNIYLISDFQDYTSDFQAIHADTSTQTYLIPLKSLPTNNLLIDSCWFEVPGHKKGREETLFVRVENRSSQSYQNIPVKLTINDTIKAINNLTIEPGEKKELQLSYKNYRSGAHRGMVELDDYPIVYDNRYYFSYEVRGKNNVLAIYQQNDPASEYLEALFEKDDNIDFSMAESKRVQVSQFPNNQCIYLINLQNPSTGLLNALVNFVGDGGTLAVFPGKDANTNAYNVLYSSLHANRILQADSSKLRMGKVNFNDPLLKDVFLREQKNLQLPFVNYSYRFSQSSTSQQTMIVRLNNTQPALAEYPFKQGRLYNFNFPLDKATTDFDQQAIFVPIVYNIALNSYEPQQIHYQIKNNLILTFPKNDQLTSIQTIDLKPQASDELIRLSLLNEYADQIRINLHNTVQKAGFYQLLINGKFFRSLAFNYNRNESLSTPLTSEQLKQKIASENLKSFSVVTSGKQKFEERIQEANEGVALWKLFLTLTLLFIAAEIAITRFWK
ncbi:MAG TPA: BatA domain-containing protein [Sunxiuqinia sp.]|nr:BatA domain-containing protein [Sunxiuqinia sp.]